MYIVDSQEDCLRRRYIGSGAVSNVYLTGRGNVYKEYICQIPEYSTLGGLSIDPVRMSRKLELFEDLRIEDVSMILAKVEQDGVLVGVITEYSNSRISLHDVLNSKNYRLNQKIGYCLKAEKIIRNCHDKGVVIGDTNDTNFLILSNGRLNMIDFDNVAYGGYSFEKYSKYAYMYRSLHKLPLDSNIDKVSFGIMVLDEMTEPKDQFLEVLRAKGKQRVSIEDFNEHIKSLSIPNSVRDSALELMSDTREKRYFGETLSELSNIDSSYLTKRKSR